MRPVYYRTDGDQDSPNITIRKAAKPPPSKHRHEIRYKEAYKKSPQARKKSTNSSSESSYEDESESEDKEKGLAINDISKKTPTKMVATRSERGRREGRTKNYENVDDVENKTSSPELEVSKVSERGRREERTNYDEE